MDSKWLPRPYILSITPERRGAHYFLLISVMSPNGQVKHYEPMDLRISFDFLTGFQAALSADFKHEENGWTSLSDSLHLLPLSA